MSALFRKFGKTNLQLVTRRSCIRLIRNYVTGTNGGSHTNPGEAFSKKPECIQMVCDPMQEPHDTQLPPATRRVKMDQVTAYTKCPKQPKKKKVCCTDLPPPTNPNKKARKPYVPGTSCKKPKASPDADPCNKLKKDLCIKLGFPNCPAPLIPPACERPYLRDQCEQPKPPFPAYSELFSVPKDNRKNECTCLEHQIPCK